MSSPSSPPTGTSVSVSAVLDFNGTPIGINSGDLETIKTQGLIFNLTSPITVGQLIGFLDWLKGQFGIPVPTKAEIETLIQNNLPDSPAFLKTLKDDLLIVLNAHLIITTLAVNTKTQNYAFGVTLAFSPPIALFGGLTFDSLGILIQHTHSGSP